MFDFVLECDLFVFVSTDAFWDKLKMVARRKVCLFLVSVASILGLAI